MEVRQKTLDLDRQACQHLLGGEKLPVIKSEIETVLKSRSYSPAQIERIAAAQTPKYAFSTRLSYCAGLRAQELGRIRLLADQPADDRPWHKDLYLGRDGVQYSVKGKGGLTREIRLSHADAARLETLLLPVPRTLYDRGIEIVQYYDIGFGQKWSNSFTKAAMRALGFTDGGHGLRHSYAQERVLELQRNYHYDFNNALAIVLAFHKDLYGSVLQISRSLS